MSTISDRPIAEAFPPGEYLREELEARGWTQTDLAEILGRPPRVVNEIIAGKRGITPETARGLGDAFGTGPEYWMNLESAYELWRVKSDNSVARRARMFSAAPIKEMIRRGWIERSKNVDVLERNVAAFLNIGSLNEEPAALAHAARKSTSYEDVTPAQRAWLYRVRQLAPSVHVKARYSDTLFPKCIARLQALLIHPQEARHVPATLAEFGIRFMVVEHLPQTRIDGVCMWLDQESPVVAVSMRFDRIDWFWHTLMHELGHVKNRDGLQTQVALDVDLYNDETPSQTQQALAAEKRANQFAVATLVPQDELDDFVARTSPLFSRQSIVLFAKRMVVHPGIVVGQLQRRPDGIGYQHSRQLLEKVRGIVIGAALTDGWGHAVSA
jgi:HTH-type transcriptional regulator/antitoxin HigA